MKPRIYFAGKIDKNDWRHEIVYNGLGVEPWAAADMFDPDFIVDCGSYLYGGPFFVRCDHGCFHGRNQHGAGIDQDGGCGYDPTQAELRQRIFNINKARLPPPPTFAYVTRATPTYSPAGRHIGKAELDRRS